MPGEEAPQGKILRGAGARSAIVPTKTHLAEKMGQHENTLRYRFSQIEKITGKSPIRSGDYEQLALAAKAIIARKLMR